MINLDLERTINTQIEQSIRTYLDSEDLKTRIRDQIDAATGVIIERIAGKVYAEVVKEHQLTEHIKSIVTVEAANQFKNLSLSLIKSQLEQTPVKDIVTNLVKQEANIRLNNFVFPDNSIDVSAIKWAPGCLNGSFIANGSINKFSSTGIEDQSSRTTLTVMDDIIVSNTEFSAPQITATENIYAKNVSILDTLVVGEEVVDNGGLAKLMRTHFRDSIAHALLDYSPLLHEGKPLIAADHIAPSVITSNLRKLGNLMDLSVLGDAKFSETLFVGANGKVGINTDEPRGALTVYDEDAEFTVARTKRKTMFIGSTRDSELEIGTNNRAHITVKENQIDINTAIQILGVKFSVQTNIPEHAGNQNDIVMVTTAKENQPIFYICKGGNRWSALIAS